MGFLHSLTHTKHLPSITTTLTSRKLAYLTFYSHFTRTHPLHSPQKPSFFRRTHLLNFSQNSSFLSTKFLASKAYDHHTLLCLILKYWKSQLMCKIPLPSFSCRAFCSSRRCLDHDPKDVGLLDGQWRAGMQPPKAPRRPFTRIHHGFSWDDPYHWLSDSSDPAVLEYLTRENEYADGVMASTLKLQQELEAEMKGRMPKELSAPGERWGPWLYYARIPEGKDYAIYLRKRVDQRAPAPRWKAFSEKLFGWKSKASEEVLLDLNEVAECHGYVQLGMLKMSHDHRLVAYTVDLTGDERFTLFVKDLTTGELLSHQKIEGVISMEWVASQEYSLFYTTPDSLQRPSRVFYHNLIGGKDDILVFEELDPQRFVDVTRTKDWSYTLINVNSKTSSEVSLIDPRDLTGQMRKVEKCLDGVQYFVEHHQGYIYILTNRPGPNQKGFAVADTYQLVRCSMKHLSFKNWQVIIPFQRDSWIEDMDIFEKHLVTYQRENGVPCINVLDLPLSFEKVGETLSNRFWTVPLPLSTCTLIPGANSDFESTILRIEVSSPILPNAIFDVDLSSRNLHLLHQQEVSGSDLSFIQASRAIRHDNTINEDLSPSSATGKEPDHLERLCREHCTVASDIQDSRPCDLSGQYVCRHFEVMSEDGVQIPLTIVHPKNLKKDGSNPALLMGYGAYGEVLELGFCTDRMSLLDRGWVLAFCHVRGGGELGKRWHDSGKLLHKNNSFHDLLACGDFLVDHKFVNCMKIAGWGESAGGLLVAAAVNIRPDFFQTIVLKVPFVDVCNTMLDPGLHLTVHEYDEWGNPSELDTFEYIRGYSPYDNIKRGASYPAMLVTAAFNDTRVGYWEAAKYVAQLRESQQRCARKPLLLKTRLQTGHFGEGGRYQHLKETAYDFAFLIETMKE